MSAPAASVVVPTRDRPGALARCLAALRGQRGVRLEVIVVDDGSGDPAEIRRVATPHDVRLLRLDGRGPAAARNAGIRAAAGAVVLLIDDDCVASPGWAAELARAAETTRRLAVGHTVHDRRRPLVAASEAIVAHAERFDGFAATRNVGVLRELALSVPFDERFRTAGGEDREWCRRLTRAGTSRVSVPGAVVHHDPDLDLAGFWRQHVRYGRGARADREWSPRRPGTYRHLVVDGFRCGVFVGAIVVLAQAATVVGYVSGRAPRPRRED